ncbi:archaellin/type IV pilin N-terminal domain-containing protein [Candidatus Nitrosotenuis cloacae]|uniref:archaellin/type IV pilin N-terminal domain-containing protein n=1 Tax=Candidatus Nitrosotenuis cloacae TaxID=1603555 RepID=UPI00227E4E96|nr:archaellin/type IV pilin N-terminal domain-containing protein [Candidatus Nitrosotenuis cloacae]
MTGLGRRRGLSEVIATLLLLGITAAGSFFLANVMQGSGFGSIGANAASPVSPTYSIQMTGYDTRDSSDLEFASLDNKFDKKLCTATCAASADNIPENGGTEFIVLQIKNVSPNSIFVKGLQINGMTHPWDAQTGGRAFNAATNDVSGNYPLNGRFSIVPSGNLVQKSDNEMSPDEEVRLVVKLSKDFATDISLSRPIQVMVDFGGSHSTQFVLVSGETK